jgi:hypothetical protein
MAKGTDPAGLIRPAGSVEKPSESVKGGGVLATPQPYRHGAGSGCTGISESFQLGRRQLQRGQHGGQLDQKAGQSLQDGDGVVDEVGLHGRALLPQYSVSA